MPSILTLLGQPGPSLIFSLPGNDPEFARAAIDGGAEALKVHIHAQHKASGTGFGDLTAEAPALAEIRALADVPIGVVVGDGDAMASRDEVARLADMGMDFIDAYTRHMPAWMLDVDGLDAMGALAVEDTPDEWGPIAALFDCIETAVLPHARYGDALTAHDVSLYSRILTAADRPAVLPTQLAITTEDVPKLARLGFDAIMIGAIVTGKQMDTIAKSCGEFRQACSSVTSDRNGS